MNFKDGFIILLSVLCYGHTLGGKFVFDDTEAIINNKDLDASTSLTNLLKNDFWGTNIESVSSHKSYRPVTVFIYRCLVKIVGSRHPAWFHSLNLILYATVCLLWYRYLEILVGSKIGFLSALLFTVHPIHTEVTASIVGCADLLCALCYCLGLINYNKSITKRCYCRYLLSLGFTVIATFCKETGITLLGVYFFIDILSIVNEKKISKQYFFVRFLGLLVTGLIVMYIRYSIMNFTTPVFQWADNPPSFANSMSTRFFTYSYIYAINILLLLWPEWLCFDWSMGCISLIENIFDLRIVFVAIFWILGPFFLYKSLTRSNTKTFFGFVLVIVPFLPASNIFFRVGFVIAERILFLPSTGYCLLVTQGYDKMCQFYPKYNKLFKYSYWWLIIIFGVRSHSRASQWLNEYDLFKSALDVCPQNAKVHYNVAKLAADNGNVKHAEHEYRLALKFYPQYEQAMNNLANLLRDRGEFHEAKNLLKRAVELKKDFAAAWMNLGIVLANLKEDDKSEFCYKEALKYRNNYSDCYYNLGNLYLKQRRHNEALAVWSVVTEINPNHAAAWSNMLILLDSLEQHEKIIEQGKKALKFCPSSASIHFTLANTLGKLEQWAEAEEHYKQAIEINPQNALYFSNFGVLYHRKGDLEKAMDMYKTALLLNPQMVNTRNNLNKLISLQK